MHTIATAKVKFPHNAKHIMEKHASMTRASVRISPCDKRKRKEDCFAEGFGKMKLKAITGIMLKRTRIVQYDA